MSQENVEMVRSVYEPFIGGDWGGCVQRGPHRLRVDNPEGGPAAGTYRGQRAVEEAIGGQLGAPYEAWAMEAGGVLRWRGPCGGLREGFRSRAQRRHADMESASDSSVDDPRRLDPCR